MPEERKSLTEDPELLERYLVWRALDRRQRRRRRARWAAVVVAIGVIGVAVGWLSHGTRLTALTASLDRHEPPSADVARRTEVGVRHAARLTDNVVSSKPQAMPSQTAAPPPAPELTAPPETARVPAVSAPPPVTVRRPARANVRAPARMPTPERVPAEPSPEPAPPAAIPAPPAAIPAPPVAIPAPPVAIPVDRPTTADLAASAAPGDDWPASTSDERRAQEPRADPTTPRIVPWTTSPAPPPVETSRAAEKPITIPADDVAAVTPTRPPCPEMNALLDGPSPDGRTRTQRISDCAGGWLKGEVREFRDGVRAGIDKIGRGLEWLGGKLRRSE